MAEDEIKIVEGSIPVVEMSVKTMNAMGEQRLSPDSISLRKLGDGTYLLPLNSSYSSFASSSLLREIADMLDSQVNEETEVVDAPST